MGIRGVAPQATIIPVRVLGASGSGWSSDVAAGITWAVGAGAEVVNLSLGTTQQSQAMTNAVTYAKANGVVVVAAAGNGGPLGAKNYPAADNRTLAVASISSNRSISTFSTSGSYVDIAAPGTSIVSSTPGGTYGYKSGTSMATPFVSGVAALLIGLDPSLTPDAVAARLTSTADDAGAPGVDVAFGHGIVNPVHAVSG
ncbi:MAG: S8 family serine peptidase [Microthrixaceae bacterium]|nr:S8 family serine peptidase [Microthrixaceae bacterium]